MISHTIRRLALLLACVACASSRGAHEDHTSASFYRLTAADLAEVSDRTLEGAIAALRPSFLQKNLRGEAPTVFINGILASSSTALRDMPVSDVAEVRFLRGFEATARYGSIHSGAIIDVVLRRR